MFALLFVDWVPTKVGIRELNINQRVTEQLEAAGIAASLADRTDAQRIVDAQLPGVIGDRRLIRVTVLVDILSQLGN